MISKEFYCDLGDIYNESLADVNFAKEVQQFYEDHPHNSGASFWAEIEDLQDELLFLKPVETSDFIPLHVQPTVKKRGRPPGVKNKNPAPKKRGRPAKKAS